MKKTISFAILLLLTVGTTVLHAKKRSVYFIGNSYTYTNGMPDMFVSFAAAMGDTVTYAMSAPGGYTLEQHTTNATTLTGISSQPWDIVVIQEQSQKPSFSPPEVATGVYPFATRLDSLVRDNDSCTQTMFMMTWGRRNGDAMNCPVYPPVCTYEGMQARLRDSYMQMALDNNASVAPMGAAWHLVIDSFPAIDLYQTDSSHQSLQGSYLQACVLYTSIFHKSAQGCTYLGGVSASVAQTLQRIADKVVLDSLEQWQQHGHYPFASFDFSHSGSSDITFSNTSERGASYQWAFGDGNTDTAVNPTHTYTAAGVYTVTLTVHTDCFSTSYEDTVHIGIPSGIRTLSGSVNESALGVSAASGGHIVFTMPKEVQVDAVEVYNVAGQQVRFYRSPGTSVSDQFPAGVYLFRMRTSEGVTTGRFVAYQ